MASAIRPIGHEDKLSLIEHLGELRSRLFVCLAALAVAFGLCMWQNHHLLHIINKPLATQTQKQVRAGRGPEGATYSVQQAARDSDVHVAQVVQTLLAPGSGVSASARVGLVAQLTALQRDIRRLSTPPQGNKPVTLGIGEPFTTTLAVSGIFALIVSLPVILFEIYGFLLPAFSPREKRVAMPLMMAIPVLFVIGVLFGYFVVLPAAVRFFQNFNSDQFNVLVQANQYYRFAATVLLAMGLIFQVPVGILGVTRAGVVSTRTLRKGRPYAVVACAVVAAFLPGDFITLILETVPLYVLYEASILLSAVLERRDERRRRAGEAAAQAPPPASGPGSATTI
jgi:sec-independent protein translocase protein TatC